MLEEAQGEVVSRHFLKRRAERSRKQLRAARTESLVNGGQESATRVVFKVTRAARGPYRWYVRRVHYDPKTISHITV